MNPQDIDQKAVALARAIKRGETGDNPNAYTAKGASGEFGAYQFMPDTYRSYAQKYLGDGNAQPSVENQNKIAYSFVKEKKDAGYTPAQIASMWNAGEGRPNAHRENWKGVNSQGVKYDTPAYVAKVSEYYRQLSGTPVAQAAGQPGYVDVPEVVAPQTVNAPVAPEEKSGGVGGFLKAVGKGLISNVTNFGQSIAGAILPYTATGRQFEANQQSSLDADKKYIDIIIERRRRKQAAGQDTSVEDEQLRNAGANTAISTAEFNPASQKTAKQVAGEAVGVTADVLGAGVFGKAAAGLKTGVRGAAIGPTLTAPLTRSQGLIQGTVQGLGMGGTFGAVQGAARGMQENKDIGGIATDAVLGGALGAGFGGLLGAAGGAIGGVKNRFDPKTIVKNRYDELADLQKNNAVIRKVIEAGDKRGIDTKKILAEHDFLVGAVDKDGTINTANAIEEMQDFLAPIERTVRDNLERDAKRVTLDEVKTFLEKKVRDSGIKGGSLRRALNAVDDDIQGYALEAGPDGSIPLTLLHDAKVDKYRNINYLNPESSRIDKAIAKGLKEMVEKNTDSIDVRKINKELSDYFATMSVLEKLNGKKVKAGRLGKYFAQTVGSIVGSHFGPLGSIVGAELGGDLLGRNMASKFGPKIGSQIQASDELLKAGELAKLPPVRKLLVKDLGTDFVGPDGLPTIDMGQQAVSRFQRPSNLPIAEGAPQVFVPEMPPNAPQPFIDPRKLPTIDAGTSPFRRTLPGKEKLPTATGAPRVYTPERQSSNNRGKRKASQRKTKSSTSKSKALEAKRGS